MTFNTQKLDERKKTSSFVLKKRGLLRARVTLVNDVSGSAQGYHNDGTAQLAFDTVYPIAIQVDDDGQLPCAIFADRSNWSILKEPMNDGNWGNYVNTHVMPEAYWNGTDYNPVTRGVLEAEGFIKSGMLGKKVVAKPNDDMSFIYFFTDGENDPNGQTGDKAKLRQTLREMQEVGANFYMMFVGIGRGSDFKYIRDLGDEFNNVGFEALRDLRRDLEGGDIYERLIPAELGEWIAKTQRGQKKRDENKNTSFIEKHISIHQ